MPSATTLRLPAHVARRHLALAAGAAAALGILAVVDPTRHALGPPCPLKVLTGLDCPLCGATRATGALVRGDVVTALDHNALYVLALPVVGMLMLFWLMRARLPAWTESARLRISLAVVAISFGVVRNLPIDAVSFLGSAAGSN